MEALYAKLYDKYVSLKKEKPSPLDEINKDQEVKFLNFVSAAEDLIQHLKDENSQLRSEVSELRNEVTSIRSKKDEECAEHQKLLLEEDEKRKMLSDEIERLQKLLDESSSLKDGVTRQRESMRTKVGKSNSGVSDGMDQCTSTPGPRNQPLKLPESAGPNNDRSDQITSQEVANGSMRIMTRKRSREAKNQMESGIAVLGSDGQSNKKRRESASNSSKVASELCSVQLPTCCITSLDKSGNGAFNDGDSTNCRFQALMEYLMGMKLSPVDQSEGVCISAMHQTSGYSFSLTWVKNSSGGEPELLYRVSTLGTFERVAPEWMRSMIMFSISMCPVFFERVARVIKLHR